MSEGLRWIQAGQIDLSAARTLMESGYYHLCAFHAQQAAEKSLKGLLRLLGRVPWGHRCFDLLTEADECLEEVETPEELFSAAQRLDGHYVPSRYPDAFPLGIPADYYDASNAEQALEDAEDVLEYVSENVP